MANTFLAVSQVSLSGVAEACEFDFRPGLHCVETLDMVLAPCCLCDWLQLGDKQARRATRTGRVFMVLEHWLCWVTA